LKINRTLTLAVIYFIILNSMSILKYLSLSSNVADLGFFDNNAYNYTNEYHRIFYGHFTPFFLLYAKLYSFFPINYFPILLLIIQSSTLCLSVFFVYRVFGKWPGIAMALYYPLWANALFDFHIDHLSIPLLAAFFAACEFRRFKLAVLTAGCLVLIKEPFALQVIGCGFYFFWLSSCLKLREYRIQLISLGFILFFWGAGWFYVVTQWVLPYFSNGGPGPLESPAFSWLGNNLFEMLWTIVSKPNLIIINIFENIGKLKYLLVLFGLLGFIPLLRPKALIVALPMLGISLVSNIENYYDYTTHYTSGLIIPIIIAFRDGVVVLKNKMHIYQNYFSFLKFLLLIILIFGHWTLSSSPISRLFWSNKVWSYSWRAYFPTFRDEKITSAILNYIPSDNGVIVSTQNTLNLGHLAHRRIYLLFPMGVMKPQQFLDWSNRDVQGLLHFIQTGYKSPAILHDVYADYVLFDLKRPWFIEDKGCGWIYGICQNKLIAQNFHKLVSDISIKYTLVYEYDGFYIYKK
jgi:uncharacterized membrane protein